MSLENTQTIDAVGTEASTGAVVLSIIDGWDWTDDSSHLLALQNKINVYLDFITSGQVLTSYPDSKGRKVRIEIVGKYALTDQGADLLRKAQEVTKAINVEVSFRHVPSPGANG